jgi:hypothetical protein
LTNKDFNHKGHPFDSPFASSGSIRAGCGTQRRKKREIGKSEKQKLLPQRTQRNTEEEEIGKSERAEKQNPLTTKDTKEHRGGRTGRPGDREIGKSE